jgi:hypothetical protein
MMTIFYSKSTGFIRVVISTEVDFNYFGVDESDFRLIYDKMNIEYDQQVLQNPDMFIIQEGVLKLKPTDASKYTVAE